MTNVSHWHKLILRAFSEDGAEFILTPLNQYQICNLLGLMVRVEQYDNGDWRHEFGTILTECLTNLAASKRQWAQLTEFKDQEFVETFSNNFQDSIEIVKRKGAQYAELIINGKRWLF